MSGELLTTTPAPQRSRAVSHSEAPGDRHLPRQLFHLTQSFLNKLRGTQQLPPSLCEGVLILQESLSTLGVLTCVRLCDPMD